jgi:hypothetical protein
MHPIAVLTALQRGQALATEVPTSNPARLAWVGVYPLDLERPSTLRFLERKGLQPPFSAAAIYHVRAFEVDRDLVANDACIAEPDLVNASSWVVSGDEELKRTLDRLGTSVEKLDLPYKSNYPL